MSELERLRGLLQKMQARATGEEELHKETREQLQAARARIVELRAILGGVRDADMVISVDTSSIGGEGPDQCTWGCSAPGKPHTPKCPWNAVFKAL